MRRGLSASWLPAALLAAAVLRCRQPAGQAQDARKTEAELKALKAEIERVASQVKQRPGRARPAGAGAAHRRDVRQRRAQEPRQACARSAPSTPAKRAALAEEKRAAPGGARPRARVARRAAPRRLPHRQRRAPEAPAESEGSGPRRPHVRVLQLFRAGARRADRPHHAPRSRDIEQLDGELAAADERLAALEAERRGRARASWTRRAAAARQGAGEPADRGAGARPEPGAHEARAGRARKAAARAEARHGEIPAGHSNTAFGRLRGKLAWPVAGTARGPIRRDAGGRREVGRRARGNGARRAGAGGVTRAAWSMRTGCRASDC